MASHDPLNTYVTSSSSSNDVEKSFAAAEKEEDLMVPVSKRDQFLSTYRRQNFDLPDSIMHYIAMNPATPKVYQSLIKSCKYFFVKNPIIVISDAAWVNQKWGTYVNGRYQDAVDLTKWCSKIWVNNRFCVYPGTTNTQSIVSNIIPKLYRFDANEYSIHNQMISFNDYVYLSSSVKDIRLCNVIIKDKNDSIVGLEKLVEAAVKANKFFFFSDTTLVNITSKTAKVLFENPDFWRFEFFSLNCIPQAFDIDVFHEYMKKNITTKFDLDFDATISEAYKARLGAIIDEILGTKTLDYKPPLINFIGINHEKHYKLVSVFHRN